MNFRLRIPLRNQVAAMQNQKILSLTVIGIILFFNVSSAFSEDPPVPPFRIGGTLTVDGAQIDGQNEILYVIMVSSLDENQSPKCILGVDTVGQGKNVYTIDIPLSSSDAACWTDEDTLIGIHVYDGYDVLKLSGNSLHLIGKSGAVEQVDLHAAASQGLNGSITASEPAAVIRKETSIRAREPH